jgi:uncharacterized damage-inducible protein DinB
MHTDTLFKQSNFQRWYLSMLVDDVADEQMTHQPVGVPNHAAWQIGHMAWALNNGVEMVGGTKTLDESWMRRFAMHSKPVGDRAAYPSKAELLRIYDDRRSTLIRHCESLSDSDWNKPNPIAPMNTLLPKISNLMHFLLLTHESSHLGQLAAWRRAEGLPQALSKMQQR